MLKRKVVDKDGKVLEDKVIDLKVFDDKNKTGKKKGKDRQSS